MSTGIKIRWMRTQRPVVNNLLFCFIGNRDTTLSSARAPLGQGLQTHSFRMHHIQTVKFHFCLYLFISLYCNITLTIKDSSLVAWTHTGVLLVLRLDAAQLLKAICWKAGHIMMHDVCFHKPHVCCLCFDVMSKCVHVILQAQEYWDKNQFQNTYAVCLRTIYGYALTNFSKQPAFALSIIFHHPCPLYNKSLYFFSSWI